VLIVAGQSGGVSGSLLASRPLRWLGERSYGIYLWHWPIVLLARPGIDVDWSPVVAGVFTIAIACAFGALSYRFVERPVLSAPRLRVAWPRVANILPSSMRWTAGTAALTIVAAFGGLTAHLPTADPIEESIRAGERVLAAQLAPSSTLPPEATAAQTVDRARLASARRPVAAPLPLPPPSLRSFRPGSVSVSAVGDSVMVGGAGALHAKLGSSGYIDAKKNRRFSEAAAIARELREQGRLGRVVIVHLGNNGPVSNEDVDALMREVSGVQNVLLVTVRVNRAWEGSVNDTLRAAAKRHRSIRIVDWHAYSGGHTDWFYSDGTHLTRNGAEEYAKLVSGSIPPPPKPKPKATPKPTPTPNPIPVPSLPVPPPA
jgi:hypothetical protein